MAEDQVGSGDTQTAGTGPGPRPLFDGSVAVAVLNEKTTDVSYQITVGTQAVELTIPSAALQTVLFQ